MLLKKLVRNFPISFRGLLVVSLSIYAIYFLGMQNSDLIASIIGTGLLGIFLATLIASFVAKRSIRKKINCECNFDSDEVYSTEEIQSAIVSRNSRIPFLFNLAVERNFTHPGSKSPIHLLSGNEETRYLTDTVEFPHRGFWSLESIEFELSDSLGLTKHRWQQEVSSGLEVSAKKIEIKPLPIIAASSQHGDISHQSFRRTGDLFDIKQYDPSDGTKRILWKTFAKSGQLVVRQPEPAVLPEGEVAIYSVAKREEDHVVGAMRSYLEDLDEKEITILFGTDGAAEATQASHVITELHNIVSATNRCVWSNRVGTGEDFEAYLDELDASKRIIERVIIFCSDENQKCLELLSRQAQTRNIELTAAVAPLALRSLGVAASGSTPPSLRTANVVSGEAIFSGIDVVHCEAV